jgi:hypothetical protein
VIHTDRKATAMPISATLAPWSVVPEGERFAVRSRVDGTTESTWTTDVVASSRTNYLNEGGTLSSATWAEWTNALANTWEHALITPVPDRSAWFKITVDGIVTGHALTEECAWSVATYVARNLAETAARLSLPTVAQVAIQYPADVDRIDLAPGSIPQFGRNTLDVTA